MVSFELRAGDLPQEKVLKPSLPPAATSNIRNKPIAGSLRKICVLIIGPNRRAYLPMFRREIFTAILVNLLSFDRARTVEKAIVNNAKNHDNADP
ncbi:MAG TPA: hypothetical protein DC054_23735 [Blastocatellia bacterium]|nr:hypothetical protein [Blastocatellia bacterium]